MESGIVGRNLFNLDYAKFGILLSTRWIKSLWKFSSEYDITITDRIHSYPQISRENDVFLMEAFEAQGFSPQKLQMLLNKCRIYLQALTLSDLMSCKGDTFTTSFFCQRDNQKRNNYYHWPFQPIPSQKIMKLWKSALKKTFQLRAGVTKHKLGRWLHSNFNNWTWFFHPHSQLLYQRFGHVWTIW